MKLSDTHRRILEVLRRHADNGFGGGWCHLPLRSQIHGYTLTPMGSVEALVRHGYAEKREAEGRPNAYRITDKGRGAVAS